MTKNEEKKQSIPRDRPMDITGVRKKNDFVTRAARNVRFFQVSRSLFPDYRFERFLQQVVFKWIFAKLKEEIFIGKRRFSLGFF